MRTVIVSLNSKYIHSSLAAWYLKAACDSRCGEVIVFESTINEHPDRIMSAVYGYKPDVIAFSCYIWNIEMVLELAENLKKVLDNPVIILGGPEVSFDSADILDRYPFVDFILSGEGEISFPRLLVMLQGGRGNFDDIEGLNRRENGKVISDGRYAVVKNLSEIPSPYSDEMLENVKDRIVYYESSRGCPFSCSYCMSSILSGVRYFPLERVYADLEKLVSHGVRQIKFVDRTFNCNPARACEIFKHIMTRFGDLNRSVNFHFEAAADLFSDEMLELLAEAPEGLIQFEIGIQSTNTATLEAVSRKSDLGKAFENIRKLLERNNIHIHLDLIAGLPHENPGLFRKSFNEVYGMFPHHFQLGFLKLLKGSEIRKQAREHGYRFKSRPPYEVLENNYMRYGDIVELKQIEELVERYHNSGKFRHTLSYLFAAGLGHGDGSLVPPYEFYRELAQYCARNGFLDRAVSARELYGIMLDFAKDTGRYDVRVLNELLKLDFLSSDRSRSLPPGIERIHRDFFGAACRKFLENRDNLARFLPALADLSTGEILKRVHFEIFQFKGKPSVYLFDYENRSRVTGLYRYVDVTDAFDLTPGSFR